MQSKSQIDEKSPVLLNNAGLWSLALLALSIVCLVIFRSSQSIDVYVSDLFFSEIACPTPVDGVRCGDFPIKNDPVWQTVRETGHNLPRLLMLATVLHLTWLLMFNANKTQDQLYPPLVAVVSGLAGPLLAVNLILKEYWGRPRPLQTSFFGGDNPYVLPGNISSFCQSNCSFVSGEAAAAFWMLALAFYFKGRLRIWFAMAVLPVAGFVAVLRITFGRHYISDVIMAALLVMFLTALSAWLLQSRRGQIWVEALRQFSNRNAFGKKRQN